MTLSFRVAQLELQPDRDLVGCQGPAQRRTRGVDGNLLMITQMAVVFGLAGIIPKGRILHFERFASERN